jgi:hypothetical protein
MKHVHKKTTTQSDSDKEYDISDKLYENQIDGLIAFPRLQTGWQA